MTLNFNLWVEADVIYVISVVVLGCYCVKSWWKGKK